jgi:cytoplasmic tRNA 2-thiolation protein 2
LLESVQDMTGREDLIEYLRMQVLQQVAKEHGYTKLVLGLCTTRIAARVLAATAKVIYYMPEYPLSL